LIDSIRLTIIVCLKKVHMLRLIYSLSITYFTFLLSFLCPLHGIENVTSLSLDGRIWILGWEDNKDGISYKEFVVNNENVENWTELFSVQLLQDVSANSEEFYGIFIQGVTLAYPLNQLENRIIKKEKGTLFGEWWIHDKTNNDKHEWIRVFNDGNQMYVIRYTTKKINGVESQRKDWEKILGQMDLDTARKIAYVPEIK
jgi:hypothetical protein